MRTESEIRGREQLKAIEEAAGCWKDEAHPELASGSEASIRQMRQESELRFQRLQQQQRSRLTHFFSSAVISSSNAASLRSTAETTSIS